MKKIMLSISTGVLLSLSSFAQDNNKIVEISKTLLGYIQGNQSEKVIPYFDETMKKSLTAQQLNSVWIDLNTKLGGLVSNGEPSIENYQQYRILYTICTFKKDKFKFKSVFNKNDQISGLFFVPVNQK